ncbi:MAG: 2-hydroxyacyl-CoA dehydratase family protein [Proteobacteria bacterium]|nr:2-hydroxyacyl-CoA dehydratase family protein [Pseudomonadota bacterium]
MGKRLPERLFDQGYQKAMEDRVYARAIEQSARGRKIVGLYCAFTPKEIVAAAGAIPVSLCSGSEDSFPAGEKHLPANLCPLIKSSYGHAVADTCPYFHMADFLLADATCDGKKKMFELLPRIKPLHLLLLPQSAVPEVSLVSWKKELFRMAAFLEKMTQNTITQDALEQQIDLYNRLRRTIEAVYALNTGRVPLAFGSEIAVITAMGGFETDLAVRIQEMESAMEMIAERALSPSFPDQMKDRPRILLTGCPTTNKKVLHLIEATGGVVVAMETCGGLKSNSRQVSQGQDPIHSLAQKYLSIACACMSPNRKRLDLISDLITAYRVDGVIDLTWNACHTYNVEAFQVREFVQEKCETPYLQILTDYSQNDIGQLETRIEAFLEMLA